MIKIAITGSTGLLGSRILELLGYKYIFIPILQTDVDITDKTSVEKFLHDKEFDFFLHLAAYTNVDGAEKDKKLCEDINVLGTKNVFEVARSKKAKFIHISTDFVFAGRPVAGKIIPLSEDALPSPISHYGMTKFEAEKILIGKAQIIRLSYPYRKEFQQKKDFVRTIKTLLSEGVSLSMVQDSLITPTYIDDIAMGLSYLIENYSPEIFHLVGADSMSPFEAGIAIAKHYGLDQSLIKPVLYEDYFKGKAPRPQYSKIVSTKNTGLKMKSLEEGLNEMSK